MMKNESAKRWETSQMGLPNPQPIPGALIQPLPQMWLSQAQRRRQKMQKKVPHMDMHTPKPGCTNFLGKCQFFVAQTCWFGLVVCLELEIEHINMAVYISHYITGFNG